MKIAKNKMTQKGRDSNLPDNERFILEQEALKDTFGPEHPGHLRGFGFGATATLVYGSGKTSKAVNSEIQELRRQLEVVKRKDEEKGRQLEEMKQKDDKKDIFSAKGMGRSKGGVYCFKA